MRVSIQIDMEVLTMESCVFVAMIATQSLIFFYKPSGAFGMYQGVTIEHVRAFIAAVRVSE